MTNTLVAVFGASLSIAACGIVKETGRQQLTLVPDWMITSLGEQSYAEATAPYREITGTPEADMVKRVGMKIAQASPYQATSLWKK